MILSYESKNWFWGIVICFIHFLKGIFIKRKYTKGTGKKSTWRCCQSNRRSTKGGKFFTYRAPSHPALVSSCPMGVSQRFWLGQGSPLLSGAVLQAPCNQVGLNLASFYAFMGKGSWLHFCRHLCWRKSWAITLPFNHHFLLWTKGVGWEEKIPVVSSFS